MASLNGQTIASSYEQLLHTDTDGGGNGNTLVTIKDGDNGTTFGLKLATNKVEVIPSAADDANAFEVSKNDGTAVFTVNTSSPGFSLAGNATITTTDNSDNIALVSTDADANSGPNMSFWRNSGSPADNDLLGQINWYAENDADEKTHMAQFYVTSMDVSDGSEDVRFVIQTILGGATETSRVELLPSETVINQDSKDIDFRVESDGNANMLVVDASANAVGVGTNSPDELLHIESSSSGKPVLQLENTNTNANPSYLKFYKNSTSPADDDYLGALIFRGNTDNGSGAVSSSDVEFASIQVIADDTGNSDKSSKMLIKTFTGNTESTNITIGKDGNVGIGTEGPGAMLHTAHSSSTAYNGGAEILESAIIQNTNGSDDSGVNNVASLGLQVASGATSQGFINYVRTGNNTGNFTFSQRTGSSSYAEHMRILSGGGITFNGDTATANALDDYEEGTATVAFTAGSGNITIGSSQMQDKLTYVKIGGVVHFKGRFTVSSISSPSGELGLSGLPFTSANPGGDAAQVFTVYFENAVSAIGTDIIGILGDNQTACSIRRSGDTDSGGTLANMVDTGTVIIITGTYFVVAP